MIPGTGANNTGRSQYTHLLALWGPVIPGSGATACPTVVPVDRQLTVHPHWCLVASKYHYINLFTVNNKAVTMG